MPPSCPSCVRRSASRSDSPGVGSRVGQAQFGLLPLGEGGGDQAERVVEELVYLDPRVRTIICSITSSNKPPGQNPGRITASMETGPLQRTAVQPAA